MATNRELNLLLTLKDQASGQLKGFSGKLQSLKPQFQKMALIGTAAFAGVAAGIAKTTQEAAIAEGTWNKFNTVFGEGADEMRAFVDDIRKEMPSATHEIARMGADLQDLLVPMGLARDEAMGLTKGFLDVANKVAAFNDVDPTQVLEAFKSGLAGSSEPLRRFGINALESSIEMEALETGLIEAGQTLKDLDPITRSQVKAQALLTLSVKQSADAINGFEENNDSLIRRQQDLQANLKEMSAIIGESFIPIIDGLVKKLIPVVEKIGQWVKENPELTKIIIIATGALAGLVAVVGILGLALPSIIAGFFFLISPIGLVVIAVMALIAVGVFMWMKWDEIKGGLLFIWEILKEKSKQIWNAVANFFKNLWEGVKNFFIGVWDAMLEKVKSWADAVLGFIQPIIDKINQIASGIKGFGGKIKGGISAVGDMIGVNDAIITPQGDVIKTNPADYLIATKRPQDLAGGGGITININGGFFGSDAGEELGDMIIKQLMLRNKLT